MKSKLILIGSLLAISLACSGQTNAIIFPQLLSPKNVVLMTNAEFRCYSGAKMFFKNETGYQSFYAANLNTNVLNALGTSVAKLEAQQRALAVNEIHWKEMTATQLAAIQHQNEQKAAQKQAAQQAQIDYLRSMSSMGRTGWDGQHYHDNQSEGISLKLKSI